MWSRNRSSNRLRHGLMYHAISFFFIYRIWCRWYIFCFCESWLDWHRRRKVYVPVYSCVLSHSMFELVEYVYELSSLRKKEICDESSVCTLRVPSGAVRVSFHLVRNSNFWTRNAVFDEHSFPKFDADVDLTFLHALRLIRLNHKLSWNQKKCYFVLIVIVWVYVE